jgi:hypothetical protein
MFLALIRFLGSVVLQEFLLQIESPISSKNCSFDTVSFLYLPFLFYHVVTLHSPFFYAIQGFVRVDRGMTVLPRPRFLQVARVSAVPKSRRQQRSSHPKLLLLLPSSEAPKGQIAREFSCDSGSHGNRICIPVSSWNSAGFASARMVKRALAGWRFRRTAPARRRAGILGRRRDGERALMDRTLPFHALARPDSDFGSGQDSFGSGQDSRKTGPWQNRHSTIYPYETLKRRISFPSLIDPRLRRCVKVTAHSPVRVPEDISFTARPHPLLYLDSSQQEEDAIVHRSHLSA